MVSAGRQDAALPQAPTYEDSLGDDWLRGKFYVERKIMLIYNPHPNGGVTELDERASAYAPGIGSYDLRMVSDVVGFIIDILHEVLQKISVDDKWSPFSTFHRCRSASRGFDILHAHPAQSDSQLSIASRCG